MALKVRTLIVIALLLAPAVLCAIPAGATETPRGSEPRAVGGSDADMAAGARSAGGSFEWVNPLPTASTLYGSAWKDGADGAILVGQAGTVLKYRPFSSPKFTAFSPIVPDRLNAIAYRPGGSTAVIVGDAGTIIAFDGSAFTPIGSGTRARLCDIAWTPDGNAAVIVGDNGTVLVFDGTSIGRLSTPDRSNMTAGAWAPSLDYAIAVGQKGAAYRVNLTSAMVLATNVPEDLLDIAYKPGGAEATAVGADGRVLSFDGQAFQNVSSEAGRSMMSVAWNADGTSAVITGYDNNAHASSIQTLQGSTLTPVPCNLTKSLRTVLWAPGTEIALMAGTSGLVAEYGSGVVTSFSSGTTNEMDAAAWKLDGSMALVVGKSGYLAKFDGSALSVLDSGSQEDLKGVAWHPGNGYALICGQNGEVLRYDAANSTVERLSTGLLVNVNYTSVGWKPDGSCAMFCGDGGKLVRYDGIGFTFQQVLPYPVNYNDVAWRPDGAFALIAGVSGNLLRYEEKVLPPYFCVTKVAVGGAPPSAGYFSVSWRTWQGLQEAMVTGTYGVVVLFNDSGAYLLQTESSMNSYFAISCLPGSGYALAVGTSGRLLVYTGSAFLRPLAGTDTTLLHASWRPDGAYALVLGQSGVVIKYDMPRPTGPLAVISWPRTGSVFDPGATVIFDGSNSTPTFGDSLLFTWMSNLSGKIGTGPRFPKVLDPGNHLVTLFANDTHGRSSFASVAISVKAPNRAPVVRIDSPLDGRTYNNTDVIEFDASRSYDPDGDPISFFWISSHGGPLDRSAAFNATLNIGAHSITAWVSDDHGYNVSRTVNITVVIFNNPPVPVISSPVSTPGQPYTTKDMILFDGRFSRDDDGDVLSFLWTSDIGGFLGGTSRFSRALPAGTHRITLWVDDSRGGNLSANVTIQVVKANEPPGLVVDTPVEGAKVFGTVQVSGVSVDPEGFVASVSVQVDNGDWQQAQGGQGWTYYIDTLNMSNGAHVIRVRATDGSAESAVLERNITVHNPFWGFTVEIGFPIDGSTINGKVKLMGTASRIGSSILQVEIRIDAGSWQTSTGTSSWEYVWDTSKAVNGMHSITVRANDGTDSSPERSITLKVDNRPQAKTPWMMIGAAAGISVVAVIVGMVLLMRRGKKPAPPPEEPNAEEKEE
jgi:hypothetical protein